MDRVLVIGDPHFKVTNRLQMEVVVDACLAEARARAPSFIVVLGDVLDRFSTIREEPLNQALAFLEDLLDVAPLFVLVGNHDRPNNATFCTTEHPFNALKLWPGDIVVVDTPLVWTSPAAHTYTFVPYVPSGRWRDALALAPGWERSRCIFAHQDFKGAVYNGLASTTGDDWDGTLPLVVSGHIHDYQTLPGVVYPGSPIQHAASERPDKGIYWLECAADVVGQRIPLAVPVYRTLCLRAADVPTAALPALPPRSVLKVLVEGTFAELQGLATWPQTRAWRAAGVVVQPKLLVPKTERAALAATASFRALMADEVRGTPLEALWRDVVASL